MLIIHIFHKLYNIFTERSAFKCAFSLCWLSLGWYLIVMCILRLCLVAWSKIPALYRVNDLALTLLGMSWSTLIINFTFNLLCELPYVVPKDRRDQVPFLFWLLLYGKLFSRPPERIELLWTASLYATYFNIKMCTCIYIYTHTR